MRTQRGLDWIGRRIRLISIIFLGSEAKVWWYTNYSLFPQVPGHFLVPSGLCIETRSSNFDMEMIFHFHANTINFHMKGSALGLILKVRVFGTRKSPIAKFATLESRKPS